MIRKLAAYVLAIVVAYLLAAISATQSVIARLGEMGIDVNFAERLRMTLHDIAGMAGLFLPMIAAGLLLAFLVSALFCHLLRTRPVALYVLAGAR